MITEENIKSFICDIGSLSGDGTYTLEANTTNDWVTPAWQGTLQVTDSCLFMELDQSYRYFRLVLDDVDDVEIGYISIGGAALQLPGIDPSVTLKYNTTSTSNFAVSGEAYGNEGYQYLSTTFNFNMVDEYSMPINGVPVASRKEILEVWKKVENINPVWVFLWSNNLDEFPPVFSLINQKNTSFKKLKYGKSFTTSIAVREVK